MKENKDFEFVDLPEETRDPEIKQEDFVLQQADSTIHEQKFQTKPTTFFKDSLKRFRKNKSSVVAAYILGILILLAIFVPIFSSYDVTNAGPSAVKNLQPKLFNSGGFWDGTITVKDREVDPETHYPDPDLYYKNGVSNIRDLKTRFTNKRSRFAYGGYIQSGFYGDEDIKEAYLETRSPSYFATENGEDFEFTLDLDVSKLKLTSFVVADESLLNKDESIPENFKLGLTSLEFVYYQASEPVVVELCEPALKPVRDLDQLPLDTLTLSATTVLPSYILTVPLVAPVMLPLNVNVPRVVMEDGAVIEVCVVILPILTLIVFDSVVPYFALNV